MAPSDRSTSNNGGRASYQKALADSYYARLGLHPSASVREIRQAYRELSKLYHPDTTTLPAAIALTKFQQLNEAYATLSSPEKRTTYDRSIGYSSIPVVQPLPDLHRASTSTYRSSSAYIDATDRPLSPGEMFALFILGLTFLCCLVLAIAIGLTRGDSIIPPVAAQERPTPQMIRVETSVQSSAVQPEAAALNSAALNYPPPHHELSQPLK